jgi:hypothetical protein
MIFARKKSPFQVATPAVTTPLSQPTNSASAITTTSSSQDWTPVFKRVQALINSDQVARVFRCLAENNSAVSSTVETTLNYVANIPSIQTFSCITAVVSINSQIQGSLKLIKRGIDTNICRH